MAGMSPHEVDVASLYDCFTGVLIANIEGYGLAELGAGGDFLRRQAQDPTLPTINPSGGLLAEGYLHGMNILAEAVWQVQGLAGPTQKPNCQTALSCSGGAQCGSALVLTRDHHYRAKVPA
jgi:acetyl-CoA acetyltransferase